MKRLFRRIGVAIGITVGVLVVLGLVLLVLKPGAPRKPDELTTVEELETYLERVVASSHPPGLSVAVVKSGRIVYANGFGVANGLSNAMATSETVYHWWSMTKIVTAVAVLQLNEQGHLDIDDPVSHYLPYFEVTYEGATRSDVTIRQVLSHSAGLPDAMPEIITWVHLEGEPPVNQSELVIEKFPDYAELAYEPGTRTQYSNWGYMILGAAIEAVSGRTYEDYVDQYILQPLGMSSTGFNFTPSMADHEAVGTQHLIDLYTPFLPVLRLGYLIRERVGPRYYFHRVYNDQTPPSGLIGSASDIALFMLAYLDGGSPILQPETVAMMNQAVSTLSDPGEIVRGLGWQGRLSPDGRRFLTHGGAGPGFASLLRVYPEENLGVVVMGNDSSMDRDELADALSEVGW